MGLREVLPSPLLVRGTSGSLWNDLLDVFSILLLFFELWTQMCTIYTTYSILPFPLSSVSWSSRLTSTFRFASSFPAAQCFIVWKSPICLNHLGFAYVVTITNAREHIPAYTDTRGIELPSYRVLEWNWQVSTFHLGWSCQVAQDLSSALQIDTSVHSCNMSLLNTYYAPPHLAGCWYKTVNQNKAPLLGGCQAEKMRHVKKEFEKIKLVNPDQVGCKLTILWSCGKITDQLSN